MRFQFVACVFVMLMLCAVAPVVAQCPGDEGSVECREIQLEVYDLVADEGPFHNHGQLMRAINGLLTLKIQDGVITGRCAACIRRQFAKKIPSDEQAACGEDPVYRVIEDFATDEFERIRGIVDTNDTTPPVARFVGSYIEIASDSWVYVLDTVGNQVFRPTAAAPHMTSAFSQDIGPNVDEWSHLRVPETTVELAREIALEAFDAEYVFDPASHVVPVRELITSKDTAWEMVRSYEGRTMVLFRPVILDDEVVVSHRTSFSVSPEGEPVVRTQPMEIPSQSYETAVTFAPAGHVMRVESGFLTPDLLEMVDLYQQAVEDGLIPREPILYEQTLRFGGFFSPLEPRLELTAYSYEGEKFLDPTAPYCNPPSACNPFWPFENYDYCYNSPYAPDVNDFIRPSRKHRYHTFNIWHEYGRKNGIRGNWDEASQSWEIPDVEMQVHASLRNYNTLNDPDKIHIIEACDGDYPYWLSVGNKLDQLFYDDLESTHVAMINTHGGPLWSDRIAAFTFQFLRNTDEWVTLHEVGDDGLGRGKLRHLFLETCSTMNWRNNYKNDPKTLVADFMNSHVADGVRTIGGFDGGRVGGAVTGWRFFGHYNAGESVSQAWINMGLEEYDCNMPIIVGYGASETDAAKTLFDGRFSTMDAGTGWAIAVEPITERHLEPRACCLYASTAIACVELTHADCEAEGGLPLDCGTTCEVDAKHCAPWTP